MSDWLSNHGGLMLAAFAAGAINALAGGGTLLTFPALNAVMSAVVANGTSTVALLPGSLASIGGYRREFSRVRRWAMLLAIPSLLGGVVGVELVTWFDPRYFERLVPWLILSAALLFLSQPLVSRIASVAHRPWPLPVVLLTQFAVAIYGGYFGAGMGIMMLAAFAFFGMTDIHEMNAVKAVQGVMINLAAAAGFIRTGNVVWQAALVMALAAMVGGFLGAHYGRRLNRSLVRWVVVAIGFILAAYYFAHAAH